MSLRTAICKGDRTSTGSEVLDGCGFYSLNGRQVAQLGDRVFCPACSHVLARNGPAQQSPASAWQAACGGYKPEPAPQIRQAITLRIGVFFDGTGNNMGNSQQAAVCQAQAQGIESDETGELVEYCKARGFDGVGGVPESSYGNAVSNVGLLHELYRDQLHRKLKPDERNASLKVYLEGIGTTSGKTDSVYAQGTGRGGTGVLARIHQLPEMILIKLDTFISANPEIMIEQLHFDIFGFSRGAAAARHFANDLHKGPSSLLGRALPADAAVFTKAFAWQPGRDVKINFIGLYDTVAAIVSPLTGNLAPGNKRYGDLQLGLAPNIADNVVQLVAGDEFRENFALTATDNDIVLPGAHADLGGGYLPQIRERVLLSKPDTSVVPFMTPSEQTQAFVRTLRLLENWGREPQHQGPRPQIRSWRVDHAFDPRSRVYLAVRVFAALYSERIVHGQLSLVYLQIMRELGLRHGVPFDPLKENMQLPEELHSIATKLQAYALGERRNPGLDKQESERLHDRYIHRSSHWNPLTELSAGPDLVFINRPVQGARLVHPNE